MLIINCLQWWYSKGWAWSVQSQYRAHVATLEYFSVGAVLRTLFAPFRQTLTVHGRRRGLGDYFSDALDLFVSRMVGFFYRSILLFIAAIFMLVRLISIILSALLWPLVPLSFVGAILLLLGVVRL